MNQIESYRNNLQIDYFSESYRRFEDDFYRFSALDIPLTFLTDDILLAMAKTQKNYFILNKQKARDGRDHYFIFKIEISKEGKNIRKFIYQKTILEIN